MQSIYTPNNPVASDTTVQFLTQHLNTNTNGLSRISINKTQTDSAVLLRIGLPSSPSAAAPTSWPDPRQTLPEAPGPSSAVLAELESPAALAAEAAQVEGPVGMIHS